MAGGACGANCGPLDAQIISVMPCRPARRRFERRVEMKKVLIAGGGMIPFRKPGDSLPYHEMGAQAAREALADADVDYADVRQAYVGYVYGDSTSGQRALYDVGMSGIPVI